MRYSKWKEGTKKEDEKQQKISGILLVFCCLTQVVLTMTLFWLSETIQFQMAIGPFSEIEFTHTGKVHHLYYSVTKIVILDRMLTIKSKVLL